MVVRQFWLEKAWFGELGVAGPPPAERARRETERYETIMSVSAHYARAEADRRR
jgi:hypothetical protein